jgi:hypothetical protein
MSETPQHAGHSSHTFCKRLAEKTPVGWPTNASLYSVIPQDGRQLKMQDTPPTSGPAPRSRKVLATQPLHLECRTHQDVRHSADKWSSAQLPKDFAMRALSLKMHDISRCNALSPQVVQRPALEFRFCPGGPFFQDARHFKMQDTQPTVGPAPSSRVQFAA